jgi:hypothetical protein
LIFFKKKTYQIKVLFTFNRGWNRVITLRIEQEQLEDCVKKIKDELSEIIHDLNQEKPRREING